MTNQEALDIIGSVIAGIAPEIDLTAIDPSRSLSDQVEIDSMDQLNIMIGVHDKTGIDIPERDYPKLLSLGAFADYLVAHSGAAAGVPVVSWWHSSSAGDSCWPLVSTRCVRRIPSPTRNGASGCGCRPGSKAGLHETLTSRELR